MKQQLEKQARIANRAQSGVKSENGFSENSEPAKEIIARRRKSTNMRSELDNEEGKPVRVARGLVVFSEEAKPVVKQENVNRDAEFVENLNASFEKERGHKIRINTKPGFKAQPSFSELAAKVSKVSSTGLMRGKVASSGLKSSGFGVPKILGRRETNPENKFLKPNLKEHLESMDNKEIFELF